MRAPPSQRKVQHQTLGNISHLPLDLIESIQRRLRGELVGDLGTLKIVRSLPHGHVAAVLGSVRFFAGLLCGVAHEAEAGAVAV